MWSLRYIGLIKYPLLLPGINETWIFLTDFKKILKYQISWKSVQWELRCLMWMEWKTDGEMDRHDEAKSRFLQFYKHAKKGVLEIHCMFYSPYTYCFEQFLFQLIFQGLLNCEERNDSGIFNCNRFSVHRTIFRIFSTTLEHPTG